MRDAGHVGAGAVQHGGDLPGLKLALVRLVAYLDDLAGVLHEVALVDGGRELDVLIAQEQGDVAVHIDHQLGADVAPLIHDTGAVHQPAHIVTVLRAHHQMMYDFLTNHC